MLKIQNADYADLGLVDSVRLEAQVCYPQHEDAADGHKRAVEE